MTSLALINTLCFLSGNGNTDEIKRLIENGLDINAQDDKGRTALICAADAGEFDCVEALIGMGANTYLTTTDGYNLLHACALNNNVDLIKQLLANGHNINETDNNGNNALHYAAKNYAALCVIYLVNNGIDFNSKNVAGKTGRDKAEEAITLYCPDTEEYEFESFTFIMDYLENAQDNQKLETLIYQHNSVTLINF